MLRKILFILYLMLFNCYILSANSDVTEEELLTALNGGIKSTEKFLERVPSYQIYEYDKTILHYAVELESYDLVEFLVSKNIELARRGGIYYETALQDAIFYQNFRIAKLLINAGTPLDIKNIDGDTALHIAAKNGYMDMIKLLIANGASKNVYNKAGNTPYDLIPKFMKGNVKKAKVILKPDENFKVGNSKIGGGEFTLDTMDYGQATFTLDEMNFDESSDSYGVEARTEGMQMDRVDEDTVTTNSNVGVSVKAN